MLCGFAPWRSLSTAAASQGMEVSVVDVSSCVSSAGAEKLGSRRSRRLDGERSLTAGRSCGAGDSLARGAALTAGVSSFSSTASVLVSLGSAQERCFTFLDAALAAARTAARSARFSRPLARRALNHPPIRHSLRPTSSATCNHDMPLNNGKPIRISAAAIKPTPPLLTNGFSVPTSPSPKIPPEA